MIKFIKSFVIFATIGYLVGSFIANSFNPTDWDIRGRGALAIVVIIVAGMVRLLSYMDEEYED